MLMVTTFFLSVFFVRVPFTAHRVTVGRGFAAPVRGHAPVTARCAPSQLSGLPICVGMPPMIAPIPTKFEQTNIQGENKQMKKMTMENYTP